MRLDSDNSTSTSNNVRQNTVASSLPSSDKNGTANQTNGYSPTTNGTSSSHTNGSSSLTIKSKIHSFYGHDREEVTRLIIQGLNDLGYYDTANRLVRESGYELEGPSVAAFRHAVLQGEWSEAESLLFGSHDSDEGGGVSISNGDSMQHEGLVLADGADKHELRFRLRKQKYLELLEERDLGGALTVLRQELTPLNQDVAQLHNLSRLVFQITSRFFDREQVRLSCSKYIKSDTKQFNSMSVSRRCQARSVVGWSSWLFKDSAPFQTIP